MKTKEIRIQKIIADCGLASRRKAEQMIIEKKVKINGRIAVLGDKADPYNDKIFVSGKRVTANAKPSAVYIMLNKPRGYITTMSDEKGRRCVAELVKDAGARVFPVGRLDKDSEGLLLLTNDGEFANAVSHPGHQQYKVYRVTVRKPGKGGQLLPFERGELENMAEAFATGMDLGEYKTQPAELRVITREETRAVLEVLLREGKNRQIRNMCESLGLEVARLKRTAVGTVKLGMLKSGKWRRLTPEEVHKLEG
ncbi:MAG: rRNA pseudouridine synthase [Oscillospiraceae bacterium]|nr:rRNA pseudouridine synthase [Oscillospiraceae bacterium]